MLRGPVSMFSTLFLKPSVTLYRLLHLCRVIDGQQVEIWQSKYLESNTPVLTGLQQIAVQRDDAVGTSGVRRGELNSKKWIRNGYPSRTRFLQLPPSYQLIVCLMFG